MTINTLILNKVDSLDIPDKMKIVLKEILETEHEMRILIDKNYKDNMGKILEKYADDEDIRGFCRRHDS